MPLRGHNSAIMSRSKFRFFHTHIKCMSEMCIKFQIPALSSVGAVVKTRAVIQCDMFKISISFKGSLFCNNDPDQILHV